MARTEQKLTVHSPLSLLSKPGAMRQETLSGFPPDRDTSPVSLPRLAFILRRPVASIQSLRDRLGRRVHIIKTELTPSGFSSSLSFRVVDGVKEATAVETIRGETLKLSQDGVYAVLTNEHGAMLRYNTTGAAGGLPTPSRRSVEQAASSDVPWYQKSAEAVGRAGVRLENIEAEIIEAPAGATVTKNDKPVARFKLRILNTPDPVELAADVYNDRTRDRGGNPYRIQQTLNKKLQAGEKVVITGHFHVDKTTFQNDKGVKPFERRWVRLLVIDRQPTG
ncbi:MAG: hypothetical protein ACRDIV_13875 [Ktedonobacteraceae bacterium]